MLTGVMVRPEPVEPLVHRCGKISALFHRLWASPEISGVSSGKLVDKPVESVDEF